MFCSGCGNEVKEGAKFCNKCGAKLAQAPVVEEIPVVEEVPVVEETPVAEAVPVVEEAPVVEEIPVMEEASTVDEILAEESVCAEALSEEEQSLSVEEVLAQTEILLEDAPAPEEIPVVEEIPVAAAVPATKKEIKKAAKEAKKAEKAAKKEAKKAGKKKKAWPWVVGILAFLLVAAFVFCYFWVNPYFAKKNAYEKGIEYLEQRDFDGAIESFKKAADYGDAAAYYEDLQGKECVYSMAVTAMEEGNYAEAGEAFEDLGDYKDSYAKMQSCLYELAMACLAQQDIEMAFELADQMDDETFDDFMTAYDENYADFKAVAIVEQLIIERSNNEIDTEKTLYDILKAEHAGLAIFDELSGFADPDLQEIVTLYRDGVSQQFAACYEGENYYNNHDFIEGAYNRAQAIEAMIAQYGLLDDYEELQAEFAGNAAFYSAVLELQIALEEGIEGTEPVDGGDGKTYQPVKNTTKTAAIVQFYVDFYMGDTHLGGNESYQYILPGETIYIPVIAPSAEYDAWYVDWEFLEIYMEEDLKVEAGVYKLQSMVVENLFYDMEALQTKGLSPESVVVTFKEDGTGTWKEMDIENAFSYSSSLIAIDGTDIRLPYSAAPGKLVVEVDSYIYVLTLESATA